MSKEFVVAIDGPSGSGKSSVAKRVAKILGLLYVDTGAMFRSIGYWCKKHDVAFEDEPAVANLLETIDLEYALDEDRLIQINGENLTEIIRQHEVSALASSISKVGCVRDYLLDFQRELVKTQVCVMEGRDIGTVVFPQAFCKIFLTATPEVRAQRRYDQLAEKGEPEHSYDQILKDVVARDEQDQNRAIAPLKQADDAIFLDTSEMEKENVISNIVNIVREKSVDIRVEVP